MAALVCDVCGGKLVMGAGGVAVCDSCGMEHGKDRMREKIQEIKGTVEVSNIANLESLMKRGLLAWEDRKAEAEGYFNKVLDINPEYAPAYVGKLCIDITWSKDIFSWVKNDLFISDIRKEEDLARYYEPLDNYPDYQKAIRFADDAYRARLEGYNNEIRKRIEELKKEYAFYMIVTDTSGYHEAVIERVNLFQGGSKDFVIKEAYHTIKGRCLVENPGACLKIKILRTGAEFDIVYDEKERGYNIMASQPGSNDIRKGDVAVTTDEMMRKKEQELIDKKRREEWEQKKRLLEKQEQEERARKKREQQEKWKSEGLCYYCGGKLSLFGKKCKSCGKEN